MCADPPTEEPPFEASLSRICEEFGISPREALHNFDYDPTEMPWWTLSEILELRSFMDIHRTFNDKHHDRDALEQRPLWPLYEAILVEAEDKKRQK